ncbi:MAG: hypothetical protein KGH57_04620 [Candidatus Micrarchaeota archaeon]|nr:hypothetical protein [Candidatus Micrarchaeota archaeon]
MSAVATKETRYVFKVVPHHKQRYETIGDWIPGRPAHVVASRLRNPDYEFLVLLHEMVEHELCKKHGISDSVVVAFDKRFEEERRQGLHSVSAEPGASQRAPYRKEHAAATRIERLAAKQLGVNWKRYTAALVKLSSNSRIKHPPHRR